MSLNRREMLRLGAAGAGGLLLTAAGSSRPLPASAFALPPVPLPPIAPPAPVRAAQPAPIGINPQLFARAKAALDSHGRSIRHRDWIGIVDFSLGSNAPRFHLVHLPSGQVESHAVAHGRGSDPAHSGYLDRFSNAFGSLATSNGTYITSDTYEGKYGHSMRVRGLDWSNNNAEPRAIVIHNAWYAEPDMIGQHGKLGRSEGCFAFSRASQWQVMSRLHDGRMIYADKLA
ncbi:MAG: murein L,D-transpeptidase catalytic domain family protein [Pseudomonadota bacterium]|nr:murein L,D-transpeptidase catalytic domain family protein [Pseudomonadota bacterium]